MASVMKWVDRNCFMEVPRFWIITCLLLLLFVFSLVSFSSLSVLEARSIVAVAADRSPSEGGTNKLFRLLLLAGEANSLFGGILMLFGTRSGEFL